MNITRWCVSDSNQSKGAYMSNCECQNWSLKDLASALQERQRGSKQIIVPMFQRGQQWTKDQQDTFIDSLSKEYPIGTMLFFKYIDEGSEKYILVDGLQRANCIKKYINHPMDFFTIQAFLMSYVSKSYILLNQIY